MSIRPLPARSPTREFDGEGGLASPLWMMGADGATGDSGAANGVPVSQSHNERLSCRRARPSHEGGALGEIAQPPTCNAVRHIKDNRRNIFFCPASPDAGDLLRSCLRPNRREPQAREITKQMRLRW